MRLLGLSADLRNIGGLARQKNPADVATLSFGKPSKGNEAFVAPLASSIPLSIAYVHGGIEHAQRCISAPYLLVKVCLPNRNTGVLSRRTPLFLLGAVLFKHF